MPPNLALQPQLAKNLLPVNFSVMALNKALSWRIIGKSAPIGFPISTEKFYTVDDRSSHATKCNSTVMVWHLVSS
jgi:hypothetical protein